jgi:hypothetical protein
MTEDQYEYCEECGANSLKKMGIVNMTRIFICTECFAERSVFTGYKKCEHEYNTHNECMHCGKKK